MPDTPTSADVSAEVERAVAVFGDESVNSQYIIALPPGQGDTNFVAKGGGACAWHSAVTLADGNSVPCTDLPYMPDAGIGCGNMSVTGSMLDGLTIVESHEYAETVTDPLLDAWNNGSTGENGDKKCAWVSMQGVDFSNGSFPVQPTWSNVARDTLGFGCVYSN